MLPPAVMATTKASGSFRRQIEPGETPQQALKREIEEELDTEIAVGDRIGTVEYDYPAFHLSMDCFWCEVVSGDLVLKEAEAARWLTKMTLIPFRGSRRIGPFWMPLEAQCSQ